MIGQTLGHYRILERLGAGGMGVVYRAIDTLLHRQAAVKVIGQATMADETSHARLMREARMASALNHPNICTVYEVGEADPSSGSPTFIAMELVEGRPLSDVIQSRGLTADQVIDIGTQIAEALAHAHERGVIHRDLKSANVMLLPDGRVKVLDFGLAKRVADVSDDAPTVTGEEALSRAGTFMGTLAYMSPEAMRGEPVDVRSDIWSLGVVLYEIASGERPFRGPSPSDITAAILRDPIPELPTGVSPQVRSVVQGCLARDPARRYKTAGEVRAALQAIGSGPQAAPADSRLRSASRRWVWGISGSVAAGAALIAGFLFWSQPRTRGPLPSKIAEANEYLRMAENAVNSQQSPVRVRQLLERALELDPYFAHARVMYGFGYLLEIDTGRSNDTTLLYRAEKELREALADDPDSARAHAILAFVYYYQGRKELIVQEAARAIALDPNEKDGYILMALYHQLNGEYEQSQALFKKLLDDNPLFVPARSNFGENLRLMGDPAGSIREQTRALEADPRHLIFAGPYLARAYMDAGNLTAARQWLERLRAQQPQNYFFRLLWALQLAVEGKRDDALRELDVDVLKYAELLLYGLYAAECYAVLGDKTNALNWLDREVRAGDERVEWFERDPLLANVRQEPRFRQILGSIRARREQGTPRR